MYRDIIYKTYKKSFLELSESKQFHLASRLSLRGDAWATQQMEELRDWFFGGTTKVEMKSRLEQLGLRSPDPMHLNAAALRIPIFESYPWLFGYELQLFQVLHAHTQYGSDIKNLLDSPVYNIDYQLNELTNSPSTLAILSTYLVDVFYLQKRLIAENETDVIDLQAIRNALKEPLNAGSKSTLSIYLLTHCIIGETLFYSRSIQPEKLAYYHEITSLLQEVANQRWDELTIDNKLEVALCLQLTGIDSALIKQAISAADAGFDKRLGFITDLSMPHKNNLEWAEHRNVLYLMTTA